MRLFSFWGTNKGANKLFLSEQTFLSRILFTFNEKVKLMGFAERYGHKPPRESLQLDSIDKKLRVKIWNLINQHFISVLKLRSSYSYSNYWEVCQ